MRTRAQARDEHVSDSADTTYILITGANAGLGLATCRRLIDEFIQTRPSSQSLHLIITTRSASKSRATLETLRAHINGTPKLKAASERVSFSSHEVDLIQLRTVIDLAKVLNKEYPFLNSLICNAGIMGTERINWFKAIPAVLMHPVEASTWPTYTIYNLRSVTKPQLDVQQTSSNNPEPPLGDVFTANVFGHYILASHLMPLFMRTPTQAGPARIIWTGSIETRASSFILDDIQCLDRREPYSSSKRLTDILALTSQLSSTSQASKSFFQHGSETTEPSGQRPVMYIAHPGVVATEIVPMTLPMRLGQLIAFYVARWLGSPWHNVSAYKGAVSTVWLALSPTATLQGIEERDGKGKWGSATDVFGNERVMRSDVEGWGYGGVVGREGQFGRKGRRKDAVDVTVEEREAFEELGREVWERMEEMRADWEQRLGD